MLENKRKYIIMPNEDLIRELRREIHQNEDKYIYFILAATIASIGFTITQTQNIIFSLSLIPLGISILCWGLSFLFGCRNRDYNNSALASNLLYIKMQLGEISEISNYPSTIQEASEVAKQLVQENDGKANKLGHLQMITFILGAFFYLVWHILEICLRT